MIYDPDAWKRIKAILEGALARPAAERQEYLATTCGAEASLRSEIEGLLAAHERAGGFLETPAVRLLEPRGEHGDLAGRAVGQYRIVSRLGAGGMGEVYLAHDEKLDRQVALKLLSRELAADKARLRRFHQEARAVSSLNHPHILIIHDFGKLDGRPFMVTEFIEGETLRQRLLDRPLPLAAAIDIALQVASALGAAHARGIVHRDIKPENLMVRPDGYVKVLDFGLAKLAEPDVRTTDGSDMLVETLPGTLMGTPRYMSPEQMRGLQLDARSDIWSVGVLLYEMATGRPPFAGATTADLIGAILRSEPVPIELQAPAVPAQLSGIVTKALRKNRAERYATIGDMIVELSALKRRLEADDSVAPAATVALPRDEPSTPKSSHAQRTRLIVLPFRLLRPDAEIEFLAFSLPDAIATTLSNLESLIVRSTMTAARFTAEGLNLQQLAADAAVDAVLTGTLLRVGGQLRINAQLLSAPEGTIVWSERMDVALENVIRIQDELSERIADSLALPLTSRDQQVLRRDAPASAKAYELYLRGNHYFYDHEQWTVARDLFIESVKEDPDYAPAWARLGRCYRLTAKFRSQTVEEMRENLHRAEVAFQRTFQLNPDLPLAHHLYTPLETDLGRAEEALVRLTRRVRQRRADPELYAGLVHACRYCGLLDASVAAHEQARRLDPQVQTGVANTYWMRGEYERAIEGMTGFFVGLPLVSLGRDAEGLALARASAEVVRDPLTRSYQSILPLVIQGETDACVRLLTELAPRNPDPESVYYIARTFARVGALDAAIVQFERVVDAGFVCCATFRADPWLEPLRGTARFTEALGRAEHRHREAARIFRDAGGDRLLGLP
jgi:serine/threonine-protein kinase